MNTISFDVEARKGKVHRLDLDRATAATIYRAGAAGTRTALEALGLFLDRRDRRAHPAGEFDLAGRWYPSEAEAADGFTDGVEAPSAAKPFTYLHAAIDLEHSAHLMRADYQVVLALRIAGCDGTEDAGDLWREFLKAAKQRAAAARGPAAASSAV